LEEQFWQEDGFFDAMTHNSIIIDYPNEEFDDEDEEEYGTLDDVMLDHFDPNDHFDFVDIGGDITVEGMDLEGPQFEEETAVYRSMEQGPSRKRARNNPGCPSRRLN
jgi:hypothetical protein